MDRKLTADQKGLLAELKKHRHGAGPFVPGLTRNDLDVLCSKSYAHKVKDIYHAGLAKKTAKALERMANTPVDPTPKDFKVVTVSTNTNSFGLYGHILMAEDGESWEAGANELNKRNQGDIVTIFYEGPEGNQSPNFARANFEIPEQKPTAPKNVISEVWEQ